MECIPPCKRRGKKREFFNCLYVKIRRDYETIYRIFKNTTYLLPNIIKNVSKNNYAILNHAK